MLDFRTYEQTRRSAAIDITVGPLLPNELDTADRIFRLAFGTRFNLPDPMKFNGDADLVRTRFRAGHVSALAARVGDELIGSSFASNWGSVAIYGPLSVRPDLWNKGVAQRLLGSTLELIDRSGAIHVGLFTPADSPKHVRLYQKFGFWPRFLTAIMTKAVASDAPQTRAVTYSALPDRRRQDTIAACRALADSVYPGLDPTGEIIGAAGQLGDTVLLQEDDELSGFAVCHWGPGTEAGSGTLYIKLAAVRSKAGAGESFQRLLGACEQLAGTQGMQRVVAGVNTGRRDAYRRMLASGFHTSIQGVAMHRPDDEGYDRPDIYILDDWR